MNASGSSFVPSSPHFFKIMLARTILSGKLSIPAAYVQKYGQELRRFDSVILTAPSNDTWTVELAEADGVVYLERGWADFVRFYSIDDGDLVVFRNEAGRAPNEFHVVVFRKTATEGEYPVRTPLQDAAVEVYILSDDSIAERGTDTEPEVGEGDPGYDAITSGVQPSCVKKLGKFTAVPPDSSIKQYIYRLISNPSDSSSPYFQGLPQSFARATGLRERECVHIRDPLRRIWPVKLRLNPSNNRLDFSKGWGPFLRSNGLTTGNRLKLTYVGGEGDVVDAQILR